MKHSEMAAFINSLNADEASRVLTALLNENPELTKKAYDIALKFVSGASAEAVMDDVFYALDALNYDDLNGRAGRIRHGYIDPGDAAWELFGEALNPFIDEMKKNQQRALPATAKAYCIGIIKGLWKYDESSTSDIKDWLPDAPKEYIYTVVEEWKKGGPDNDEVDEMTSFVEGGPQ